VGAGVLAALQTFLGFEQRAAKHRETAAAYGGLRRELEAAQAVGGEASLAALLGDLRGRWDALDANAAATSPRIYRSAVAEVVPTGTARETPPAP
jgi:hypothetical protein